VSVPNQQQPSPQDIMKRLRNDCKLAFSDAEEITLNTLTIYEKQVITAAQQIQTDQKEIIRLQELCTKNKIEFTIKEKPPNRAQRRATDKKANKKPSGDHTNVS